MRSGSGTRKTWTRRLATIMAATGALLVSSGIAMMATPTTASAADECVPSQASTDTTGWVAVSPGDGWRLVDTRTVQTGWQRYSWVGGPRAGDDPPAFPGGNWQANVAGDPQGIGVEGAYYVSHGGSGNGDWFYLESVDVTQYKFAFDHPAVTCETEAYAEVQWLEPACGSVAGFETSSGDPVDVTWSEPSATPAPGVAVALTATAMKGYSFAGLPTKDFTHTFAEVVPPEGQTYDPVSGICAVVTPPIVEPPVSPTTEVSPPKAETTTPTVVHAGLAGETASSSDAAIGLVGVGLLLVAGAGSLVVAPARRRTA
jgi:hypothetical protein